MAASDLRRRHARFPLLQDRNDLPFVEPAPLHCRPTPSCSTLQSGGHISGKHVNCKRTRFCHSAALAEWQSWMA